MLCLRASRGTALQGLARHRQPRTWHPQRVSLASQQDQSRWQRRTCSSCASSASSSPAASSAAPTPTPPPPPADSAPNHRIIGPWQELFITSPYSPGSAFFLPNGARLFGRLVDFLRQQYVGYGFQEVITPTIYKKALWAKSGHLENYADDMYTVTGTSPSRTDPSEGEGEEHEYGLKPMNCPGHCLIFASKERSYRDLPIRYADFGALHRNEATGALTGLTRVRRFHQDDGHIFCRPVQIEAEIAKSLDLVRLVYGVLGLGPYRLELSTRPETHYMGSLQDWDQAEGALRRALDASGQPWTVNPGDGAFYGPKIDVMLRDAVGKEHQTATIQLDFQLPKRFDLEYTAPAPEAEQRGETSTDPEELARFGPVRPVMIHRAVLGSVERLMALLIEHYNGKWPFWLNPRQAIVITLNDSEPVVRFAQHTRNVLLGLEPQPAPGRPTMPTGLAVDYDDSPRTIGLKIRDAKKRGYGVIAVIGPRDVERGVAVVDATAAPPRADLSEIEKKALQKLAMTPEELLAMMKSRVAEYR